MCRVLGVTRNGYYSFQRRLKSKPSEPQLEEMLEWIKEIAEATNYSYGYRRIRKKMNALGYPIGRHKTQKLMKMAGVQVRTKKKYKATTDSKHQQPVFENVLDRKFNMDKPDQAYVSDITYIWTQEGWLYLAVVIDLYSRKVVGWSMGSRMKAKLVCDALTMAIWQRQPKAGLIVHSDRGSQYASQSHRKVLTEHQFIGSMSRKGNSWDNAVCESFFGSMKQERVQWCHYQTRAEAQQDVLNYITMFYNSHRLHSSLDYKSPMEYEQELRELSELKKVS